VAAVHVLIAKVYANLDHVVVLARRRRAVKITKRQLVQIIKEELDVLLNEAEPKVQTFDFPEQTITGTRPGISSGRPGDVEFKAGPTGEEFGKVHPTGTRQEGGEEEYTGDVYTSSEERERGETFQDITDPMRRQHGRELKGFSGEFQSEYGPDWSGEVDDVIQSTHEEGERVGSTEETGIRTKQTGRHSFNPGTVKDPNLRAQITSELEAKGFAPDQSGRYWAPWHQARARTAEWGGRK